MKKLNKIYSTKHVGAIDEYVTDYEKISSWHLMERAAEAWVSFFEERMEEEAKIAVVCGDGNNGGDGYAIARLLLESGWEVEAFALPSERSRSGDCEKNRELFRKAGGKIVEVKRPAKWIPEEGTVIVDALFGAGLNRAVTGAAAEMIRRMNELPCRVYAVDMPSGLMGEDNAGNDRTAIVRAYRTFTFQFPKISFLLPENAEFVGEWEAVDIGVETDALETPWYALTEEAVREALPRPGVFAHKGTNGRGLLVAGSRGMMGAAVLAAKGALHSGVGVLHCHVPGCGGDVMQVAVPETVLDLDGGEACVSGVEGLERYDAVAVGPGIGRGEETAVALKRLLTEWKGRLILDADALNILAEHPEWLVHLHEGCLLTPHVKEFERLAGKCANDFDRLNKLLTFAAQYRVHVVLKGAYSAVATPDGRLYFNMSGNPGMAKGGSGDVLTGVLLALAANGLEMEDVACIGVFAHGMAGDLLREEHGMRGMTAGLLAEGMGRVWSKLEGNEI